MKDSEIDIIHDYIDLLLRKEQYFVIDSILLSLYLREIKDVDEILSYLTATLPAKSKLANRIYFITKLRKIDEKLLKGLE